jgi:hypothetical protein
MVAGVGSRDRRDLPLAAQDLLQAASYFSNASPEVIADGETST